MKIQPVTEENRAKVYALLRRAFPGGYEARLVQALHDNARPLHEWVCLHIGKAIAYIAFSLAYQGENCIGLHLGPLAVAPEFQREGLAAELLTFALRQKVINSQPLFVLGELRVYRPFGFEPCRGAISPLAKGNSALLSLRTPDTTQFTLGYEAEFKTTPRSAKAAASSNAGGKQRR